MRNFISVIFSFFSSFFLGSSESKKRVWVLGAPDPEMERIEALLREAGEEVIYLLDAVGQRAHGGNAYRLPPPTLPKGTIGVVVECIDRLPRGWSRVDHHRPGDPGFGLGPEDFIAASSLGQVISLLILGGWYPAHWAEDYSRSTFVEPGEFFNQTVAKSSGFDDFNPDDLGWFRGYQIPKDLVLAMAADHCLGHAYKGLCPGVEPDELMAWRASSRAAFQGRTESEVLADIEAARKLLQELPKVSLGNDQEAILVGNRKISELPEASAREGVCFVASGLPDRSGRVKTVIQSGSPEQIKAFLEAYVPEEGLVDAYGDPARGFAGAYEPAPAS